jgi:hypothetical protein
MLLACGASEKSGMIQNPDTPLLDPKCGFG